jgi:hypothetical protein
MIFFDYVFYRVCKVYARAKSSSPEATAAIVVALMQCFNLFSLAMLIEIIRHKRFLLNKPFVLILYLLLLVVNYVRYVYREGRTYKVICENYVDENKPSAKGTLVVLYIICSTGLVFAIAIYEETQTW